MGCMKSSSLSHFQNLVVHSLGGPEAGLRLGACWWALFSPLLCSSQKKGLTISPTFSMLRQPLASAHGVPGAWHRPRLLPCIPILPTCQDPTGAALLQTGPDQETVRSHLLVPFSGHIYMMPGFFYILYWPQKITPWWLCLQNGTGLRGAWAKACMCPGFHL